VLTTGEPASIARVNRVSKSVLFGVIITVTCLYQGFRVQKDITAIPAATSRAMVESSLLCLLVDVGVSLLFYL
jgi:phospholipid/cholesterol/gamma-HCH transport system permease protein